jgi:hypothetical protein
LLSAPVTGHAACLSWSCRALQSSFPPVPAPYWIQARPSCPWVLRTPELQGFYTSGSLPRIKIPSSSPLLSFHSPSEITSYRAAAGTIGTIRRSRLTTCSTSRGFSSPTASLCDGQRLWVERGFTCLEPPAPPRFLNALVLSSARNRPALFHARSAHGVTPFKALLPRCSRPPSPTVVPLTSFSACHPGFRRPDQRRSTEAPRRPNRPPCGGLSNTPRDHRGFIYTGIRHSGRAV